ncbi:GntR family transcriptional regulator [Streptomyces sp. NPDC051561]|uniref:GntR family transcriptional regulator n=1 Tax=Streptomyces sp. NPDC051561 TaxID=3365658 RepID=UPI0037A80D3A
MIAPAGSLTAAGRATAALRQRIASGTYPAGAPLPLLQSLAADLKVGMQTLHEALGRLADEGLIERGCSHRPYVLADPAEPGPVARTAMALRTRIATGTYTPGRTIHPPALAAELGVSRAVAEQGCKWARHEGYLGSNPLAPQVLWVREPREYALPEPHS